MEFNESKKSFHGLKEADVELFVGNKSEYYLQKWKYSADPEKTTNWNWMGFLGGIFWLGYRKMYDIICICLGIVLLFDALQYMLDVDFSRHISISLSTTIGLCGNTFYYKHVKKKINHIYISSSSTRDIRNHIKNSGGTSWKGVFYTVVLIIIYLIATNFLESFIK